VEVAYQLGVSCIEAPETLYRLLRSHRLVISSGGNTLYEAAATGTPTFVTWEDPHEEEQALAFMAAGATRVLGQGTKIDVGVVREMIGKALESPQMLSTMAQEGRRLVDGHGARRIVQAILGLESREKAAWSGDRARSLRSVR
jgi:UDP-N-acetylglucosamine:LPS N-acetylglucosamine transferase